MLLKVVSSAFMLMASFSFANAILAVSQVDSTQSAQQIANELNEPLPAIEYYSVEKQKTTLETSPSADSPLPQDSVMTNDSSVQFVSPNAVRTSELMRTAPTVPESASAFILQYDGEITFTGGEWVYPNTGKAMQRAISSVGDAVSVCVDGRCYNKCDHIAGDIWGYEVASGYRSAATHWATAKSQGIARLKDKEPPLGALLFWKTGRPFGHVATYIGNGMVVTNAGGEYGSDIYVAYADAYDRYGWEYLGWADPVFFGEAPGTAL